MAHPHNEHRQHKVEKARVAHIAHGHKHRASGGRVHEDEKEDRALIGKMIREHDKAPEGKKAKHRRDRVTRARGGKVGHKKGATHVNVIVNGGGKEPMPIPMPAGGPPIPPPGMAPPPVAGLGGPPPGMPPGGPPPGMIPPRARGGKVKSGPAWEEGRRDGTQVQPSPGKGQTNTPANLDRGRPVTFSSGGVVKSFFANGKPGKEMGPKFPGGVVSGETRKAQAHRAAKRYHRPLKETDGAR